MTSTLILPTWLIGDTREVPRRNWGVRIADDRIADVAPNAILRERYPNDQYWEASDQVLAPGVVNTHTHLYGILAHGIPLKRVPTGFFEFLNEFWWPNVENRLDHAMLCAATDLQCVRMLSSGVTTFYDCLEAPFALPGCLAAQAEVVRRRGIRGVLSFEATERVSAENGQLGLRENVEFIESCARSPGLVSGIMCFHTTFTCSADFIRQVFAAAEKLRVPVHMHCAEGAYEPRYTLDAHVGK